MKPKVLEELRREQEKPTSMIGRTMRLPIPLDEEINEFCLEHRLNRSNLYRRLIAAGWRELNK